MRYVLAALFCMCCFGGEPDIEKDKTALGDAGKTKLAFLFRNAGTNRDLIYEVRWFWPSGDPTLEKFSLDNNAKRIHSKDGAIGAQIEFYGMVFKAKTVRLEASKVADEKDCEGAVQHFESPDGGKTIKMEDGDGLAHEEKARIETDIEAGREKKRHELKLEGQQIFKMQKERDEKEFREQDIRRKAREMQDILRCLPLPGIF